jgi:hypothetical protein
VVAIARNLNERMGRSVENRLHRCFDLPKWLTWGEMYRYFKLFDRAAESVPPAVANSTINLAKHLCPHVGKVNSPAVAKTGADTFQIAELPSRRGRADGNHVALPWPAQFVHVIIMTRGCSEFRLSRATV